MMFSVNAFIVRWLMALTAFIAVFFYGFVNGENHVRQKWDAEKITAQKAMLEEIEKNSLLVAAKEKEFNDKQNKITSDYAEKIKGVENEKQKIINSFRIVSSGVRDTNPNADTAKTRLSDIPKAVITRRGSQLLEEDARFLLDVAADADKLAEKYNACVKINNIQVN